MAQNNRRGAAARCAAMALVRSLGATCIQLQMPALPVADDDGEELGLRTPQWQFQALAPVAVRRSGATTEVLVPAGVLKTALGVQGEGALAATLAGGAMVALGDELYKLDRSNKKEFMQKMRRISDKWKPYRTYACLHLWQWKDTPAT